MITSGKLARYFAFVRHTPPNQLFSRLRLLAKRKAFNSVLSGLRGSALSSQPYDMSADPPQPAFEAIPSAERVSKGAFKLTFLNEARTFTLPFDWHAPELDTGTRLWKLNLHYHEFLRALDPTDARAIMLDWIDQNDPYRKTYWMDSWNSYALSIRIVSWMEILTLHRLAFGPADLEKIHRSLLRQVEFLERNIERDILGNHIVKNIKALVWASAYFDQPAASVWRRNAAQYFKQECLAQVLGDGMHFERSASYHAQVFADFLAIRAATDHAGFSESLEPTLELMAQALADLTHPDGGVAQFNDAGLNMGPPVRACLDAYARLLGRPAPTPQPAFAYAQAGLYGARLGQGPTADCCVVKMGPLGPDGLMAHAHGDWGSFEWSLNGQRVIVDQGVHRYSESEERRLSRSTASHNTAMLDEAEQADFFGAFRCGGRPHPAPARFEATAEGFELEGELAPATHPHGGRQRRRMVLAGRMLRIEDEALAGRALTARLLLHPSVRASQDGEDVILSRADDGLQIIMSAEGGSLGLEPARWWPDMGREEDTTRIVVSGGGALMTTLRGEHA